VIAIADQQAQVAALQAGQIDMVLRVDRQALALFAENPAFTAQSVTTGGWVGLAMRADTAPFTDARVRRALRIFADRDAMGKLVFGEEGYTVTCDNPVWAGDQYRADLTCPADIASAKSLLAEAGYPNGIDVKLHVSDIAAGAMRLAEVYQAQAKAAGINVEIVSTPADGYWNDVWMKEGFVATTWSQRPADQILNEAYRSTAAWNETFWQDAGFDALLDKARQELSLEGRTATYVAAQTQLFDEGGTFIPFHINETRILSSRLSGLPAVEEFTIRYEDIQKAE
jgi:peptide/nickel transport system substrate-binding protein